VSELDQLFHFPVHDVAAVTAGQVPAEEVAAAAVVVTPDDELPAEAFEVSVVVLGVLDEQPAIATPAMTIRMTSEMHKLFFILLLQFRKYPVFPVRTIGTAGTV